MTAIRKLRSMHDATPHLRLLYQEAGLEYPEGLTFLVPVAKWHRWVKTLHLQDNIQEVEDAGREKQAIG